MEYILLIISTALINNFVLVKFLGLCPFMGVSKKVETAAGMGLATMFVLTVASLCSYLVNTYLLIPLQAEFLRTLVFILVIAVVVQFTEMVISAIEAPRNGTGTSAAAMRSRREANKINTRAKPNDAPKP